MRTCIYIASFLIFSPAFAQQGDELLVYAVKGKVTAFYNNQETVVKIGKVLHPGTVLKTDKGASLTLLCSKGRPLSINKEGTYPVNNWKDSCRSTSGSLSSSFFKYIWGQMYIYSPEHKEEQRKKSELAVVRGEEPVVANKKVAKLEFKKGMDTVHYDGNNFPLSWNGINYNKPYVFNLYDTKGKTIYSLTTRYSYIPIDSFRHVLAEGNNYRWSVSAKGLPVSRKRVLKYIPKEKAAAYLEKVMQPLPFEEDTAASYYRRAFLLEKAHYLAQALLWYEKAMQADPEMDLYRDQYIRFSNDFWIR